MKTKLGIGVIALVAWVLAGCSTVESRVSGHRAEFDTWPPPVQQAVSAGQIGIGFTHEQVQVALGDPDNVFSRTAATGSFEVWSYGDHGPRFSIGIGMASFGRNSAFGTGVGVSNIGHAGERMRVIFDQTGRVASIEKFMRP